MSEITSTGAQSSQGRERGIVNRYSQFNRNLSTDGQKIDCDNRRACGSPHRADVSVDQGPFQIESPQTAMAPQALAV
jgi:hypothetical protein